jgi:hypothetical protein
MEKLAEIRRPGNPLRRDRGSGSQESMIWIRYLIFITKNHADVAKLSAFQINEQILEVNLQQVFGRTWEEAYLSTPAGPNPEKWEKVYFGSTLAFLPVKFFTS